MIWIFSVMFFGFGVVAGLWWSGARLRKIERDLENVIRAGKANERTAEEQRKRASRHENIIIKASQMLNEYRSQFEKI